MDKLKKAFEGFDINELDFSEAGDWPIGIKIVSYILIICLLAVGGWFYYVEDKKIKLEREIKKETELRQTYKAKAFEVANLAALKKQMADVEERFAAILKQLPTEKEVPGLLEDITNLGTSVGLDIGTIALASERKEKFYIELPINIVVQGAYHQFGQFVSGIAALSRIVTLHDYNIKPSGGSLSMTISAKTYRYDDTK
ncbi:type 4a pilus biogenesis protein PilO [Pontibacter sp. JAM-7]|uniref:type 4a pilus biogenesis protein PilO n=1 Tax=Pontibacter sp. JAM-7 TaxID=3366581 RepID=UPI003AF64DC2